MAKRDYYDVLGVGRTASDAQIKAAYRKAARKYHPDVNKAADSAAKFREATEAYEVLGDTQKRKQYDQFGHAVPGMGGGGGPGGGPGRTYTWSNQGGQEAPFDFQDIFGAGGGSGGFSGMSLQDILEALGGGGRRRGRGGPQPGRPPITGQDLEYHLSLTFLQAVKGSSTTIRLQMEDGSSQTLTVKIPPGVREGSKIRLRGKGAPGPGGPGDLYIVCHVAEHSHFHRVDNDIHVEVPISITEAALGAKVDVPTLDGLMTVTIPPGTPSGRKLRIKGKGVAVPGGVVGDLYVGIRIVPPAQVSAKGAQLLRQFDETEQFDPRANVPWR